MELIIDVVENSVVGVQISLHTSPEEKFAKGLWTIRNSVMLRLILSRCAPGQFPTG